MAAGFPYAEKGLRSPNQLPLPPIRSEAALVKLGLGWPRVICQIVSFALLDFDDFDFLLFL